MEIRIHNAVIPSSGFCEIQMRLYKEGWVAFDESNDPSYLGSTTFVPNQNVGVGEDAPELAWPQPSDTLSASRIWLTKANQEKSVNLVEQTQIAMTGFPKDWTPNTLSLQFVPQAGNQLHCNVALDNRLFAIDGYYSVIHVPLRNREAITAKIQSCDAGSALTAKVQWWVDQSNQITRPIAQTNLDPVLLPPDSFAVVQAQDYRTFSLIVPSSKFARFTIQGLGSPDFIKLRIDGVSIIVDTLPWTATGDIWAGGAHKIQLLTGKDAGLTISWHAQSAATWDTVHIEPTTQATKHTYDLSSVPKIARDFELIIPQGIMVNDLPPRLDVSPRPTYNPYLGLGQKAVGPLYKIQGNITPGCTLTFALPLPDDPSIAGVKGFAVFLESDDGARWSFHRVDSIVDGLAYFQTTHFSSGGLITSPWTNIKGIAEMLNPMGEGTAKDGTPTEKEQTENEEWVYNAIKGLTAVDTTLGIIKNDPTRSSTLAALLGENDVVRKRLPDDVVIRKPLQSKRPKNYYATWRNLEILIADRLQALHMGVPQIYGPGKIIKQKWSAWSSFNVETPYIEFSTIDTTKEAKKILKLDLSLFFKDFTDALDDYSDCDEKYWPIFCVGAAKTVYDEKGAVEGSDRDEILLDQIEILTRLQILAYIDKPFGYISALFINDLESSLTDYIAIVGKTYRNNNIVVKAKAAIALGKMLRNVGVQKVLASDYCKNNWSFTCLAVRMKSVDSIMPSGYKLSLQLIESKYLKPLFDESSGGYAEGVGYLNYLNDNLFPLYALGVRLDQIKVDSIPLRYRRSGTWLLNMMWNTGSAVDLDDGVSGAKIWLAPYALITGDPKFLKYQEDHYMQATKAPAPYSYKVMDLVTYPYEMTGSGDYTPVPVLGGVGRVSYQTDDKATMIEMRMIGESSAQQKMGYGHDQQDNTSVTLTVYKNSRSVDLLLDPGYPEYEFRGETALYEDHNTLQINVPKTSGGVYPNVGITSEEAWDMLSGKVQNLLRDADHLEYGTITLVTPWFSVPYLACERLGYCKLTTASTLTTSPMKASLFKSGGGALTKEMKPVTTTDPAITGVTATIGYDNCKVGTRQCTNERTILQWDGDFFVIDRPDVPEGTEVTQHWNLPRSYDAKSLDIVTGIPTAYNIDSVSLVATWFTQASGTSVVGVDKLYPLKSDEYPLPTNFYRNDSLHVQEYRISRDARTAIPIIATFQLDPRVILSNWQALSCVDFAMCIAKDDQSNDRISILIVPDRSENKKQWIVWGSISETVGDSSIIALEIEKSTARVLQRTLIK